MSLTDPGFRNQMYEQAALWRLSPDVGQQALVRLACDALVDGRDSPGLVRLAGQSVTGHDYDFAEAVASALDDFDLTLPGENTSEAQVGAARAMSRQVLAGAVSPRELAGWAHVHVGHSGAAAVQPLVELDDAYDTAEYVVGHPQDLNSEVLTAARTLLADD